MFSLLELTLNSSFEFYYTLNIYLLCMWFVVKNCHRILCFVWHKSETLNTALFIFELIWVIFFLLFGSKWNVKHRKQNEIEMFDSLYWHSEIDFELRVFLICSLSRSSIESFRFFSSVYSLCLWFVFCHPFWLRSKFFLFLCTWFRCDFSSFSSRIYSIVFFLLLFLHSFAVLSVSVCVFLFRMVANLMFNYYEVCVLRFFFDLTVHTVSWKSFVSIQL